MSETYQGHCLCGSVKLEGRGTPTIDVCHCDMCLHWNGGPAIAVMFKDKVHIVAGQDLIGTYQSSDIAERCFCKRCGATLYYKMKDEDLPYGAQAGLFDLPKGLSIQEEIFVDEQPDYYRFDTTAPRITRAQMMERLAAYQAKKKT